jgi:hypothetical protein
VVTHELTDTPSSNGEVKTMPKSVKISGNPAFSPNELRVLKAMSGKTLEQIMNDEVDAVQAMVWSALRDEGYNPTWDDAGDVKGEMTAPEDQLDPTTGNPSTTSPPSADSGAVCPPT